MRLTKHQQALGRSITRASFGAQVRVSLFGSRISPLATGGDLDLLVEFDAPATPQSLKQELLCKIKLVQALDLPVDLIVRPRHDTSPIALIARRQGFLR